MLEDLIVLKIFGMYGQWQLIIMFNQLTKEHKLFITYFFGPNYLLVIKMEDGFYP